MNNIDNKIVYNNGKNDKSWNESNSQVINNLKAYTCF